MTGRVLKAYSGRYLVEVGGQVRLLAARGRMRRLGRPILTGDMVDVEQDVIVDVLPPRTELRRPPVANVDVAFIVFSLRQPPVSAADLDRQIAHVARAGVEPLLVLNKIDLVSEAAIASFLQPYRRAAFPVVLSCGVDGRGKEELLHLLGPRTAVLVGPSGVGKSSLARQLTGRDLSVAPVSAGTGRGRHTTRWCELLPAGEGYLVDTPGFQELSVEGWEEEDVALGWPEFQAYRCRFRDCRHTVEPGCAVREAVARGAIDQGRFERYLALLEEVKEWRSSHPPY